MRRILCLAVLVLIFNQSFIDEPIQMNKDKLIERAEKVIKLAQKGIKLKQTDYLIQAMQILLKNEQIVSSNAYEVNNNFEFTRKYLLDINFLYKQAETYLSKSDKKNRKRLTKIKERINVYNERQQFHRMGDNNRIEGAFYDIKAKGTVPIGLKVDNGVAVRFAIVEGYNFKIKVKDTNQNNVPLSVGGDNSSKEYSFTPSRTGEYQIFIKNDKEIKLTCSFYRFFKN